MIKRVYTNNIALLQARCVEPGYKPADERVGLVSSDVVVWISAVDVDLSQVSRSSAPIYETVRTGLS